MCFSEDFAQFASNFRWRLQARESRGHRAPVNDRLRSRRFRGRHTPYTNLWDSPPGARREAFLAEFGDFTPRPVPSGDNTPIVIDEEVFIVLIFESLQSVSYTRYYPNSTNTGLLTGCRKKLKFGMILEANCVLHEEEQDITS